MSLKRPIKELQKSREEFIRGGGLVASDINDKKEEWTKIVLRIKSEALSQIDEIVDNKMGLTRTGWILQAIEEKLDRVL